MTFKNSFVLGTVISALILFITLSSREKAINSVDNFLIFMIFSAIGGLVLGTCIYFTAKSNGVFLIVPIVGAFIIYSISQSESNKSTSKTEETSTQQSIQPAPPPEVVYVEPPKPKIRYQLGDAVSCLLWGDKGDKGWSGVVIDIRDDRYLVEITKLIGKTNMFGYLNFGASTCTGNQKLDIETAQGTKIWVPESCLD